MVSTTTSTSCSMLSLKTFHRLLWMMMYYCTIQEACQKLLLHFRKSVRKVASFLKIYPMLQVPFISNKEVIVAATTSWNTGKTESIRFRPKEARCFASSFRAFLFCFFCALRWQRTLTKKRDSFKSIHSIEVRCLLHPPPNWVSFDCLVCVSGFLGLAAPFLSKVTL